VGCCEGVNDGQLVGRADESEEYCNEGLNVARNVGCINEGCDVGSCDGCTVGQDDG